MSLVSVGFSLLLLSQSGVQKHHIPPPLEEEGDPPALFSGGMFSTRLIVPFGNFTSYQVNVNAAQQNILGDAANEPSICVDPANPNRIAIGWRQFDSVSSNFRQGGYGYSTDGGLTWHFPGVLENNVFRSDPVLQSRYDGTFLYLSLLETFYDNVFQSTNGGNSWSMVAAADGGDKEWFTVDNTTSSGRGNLYQIWSTAGNNYGGRQFTKSTDGGATWLNPLNIPDSPYWGTLDVDNNGTLFVGGWSDTTNGFVVTRSLNAKNAGTPTFDTTHSVNLGGSINYGQVINPGGLSGQLWIAVDRSVASTNPVYALCSVSVNTSNPCDLMVAKSADSASTWAAPVRINDDPLNSGAYHWMGTLAVSPTGRLDAVWNDTRNDSSHATSSLYYAYSLDGGQHFSANIRVTPSFNQSVGYPNQNKMGDYLGVVSNSIGANIAFCATFNNEEDIYYMQIPSPVVVPPSSFQVVGGVGFVGGLGALAAVDNSRLTVKSGYNTSSGSVVDLVVNGTSPSLTPKALLFNLVADDAFSGENVSVRFFNWTTQSYEAVGTTTSTAADSTYNVLATGDLTRFINPSGGAIRADIHWAPPNPQLRPGWTIGIDQAVWNVIP